MKISKLALIALLGGALMSFGCSDDSNGTGGTGGTGGGGGEGGGGGAAPACLETGLLCENGAIGDHFPCCDIAPPEQANACDGTESTVNPTSCTSSGEPPVRYVMTVMTVAGDCNVGYDLDGCNGNSCDLGALAPNEGLGGVDNALAGLAPTLAGVGGNLDGVNQAFSDAICGQTDDPEKGTCEGGTAEPGTACIIVSTCEGGANDGNACEVAADCPDGACITDDGCPDGPSLCEGGANDGNACEVADDCPDGTCADDIGKCNLDDDDCLIDIPPIEIKLAVVPNPAENCAIVVVTSDEIQADPVILNLGDPAEEGAPACLSGTVGTIPVTIGGVAGAFGNVTIRTSLSADGFSDGLLGMTVDADTAVAIAEALLEGAGAVVGQVLDIQTDLSGDSSLACNALSATFDVGGVAEAAPQ